MKRFGLAMALILACLLLAFGTRIVRAEEGAKKPESKQPDAKAEPAKKYIRVSRNDDGQALALQTSIVRFVPTDAAKGAVAVDLIGAVHVGEKSYYDALNKKFEDYDVVLFELVAPPGTKIPKGGRPSTHPIGMLQNGMKNMLGLEHQLAYIDYTKDNFVHADMSPEEFDKSMSDRNESFLGMFFRMMGQAMAQQSAQQGQGRTTDFDLIAALFDPDRAGAMKRIMAEQFETADGMMQALEGPEGSTLITERNKVALKKLAEQLAAGKKKVAIFYGAGHLNDMEKRLVSDFQLKRADERWLDAWKLEKSRAKKPKAVAPAKKAA